MGLRNFRSFRLRTVGDFYFPSLSLSSWPNLDAAHQLLALILATALWEAGNGRPFLDCNYMLVLSGSGECSTLTCWPPRVLFVSFEAKQFIQPQRHTLGAIYSPTPQFPSERVHLTSFCYTGFGPGRKPYWIESQTSCPIRPTSAVSELIFSDATFQGSATRPTCLASALHFLASRGMYLIQINKSNLSFAKQIVDYLVPLPLWVRGICKQSE